MPDFNKLPYSLRSQGDNFSIAVENTMAKARVCMCIKNGINQKYILKLHKVIEHCFCEKKLSIIQCKFILKNLRRISVNHKLM